jgi:hypothetical protein
MKYIILTIRRFIWFEASWTPSIRMMVWILQRAFTTAPCLNSL